MTRLIDADALKEYIDTGHLKDPSQLCFSDWDVLTMINNTSTAEAIPIEFIEKKIEAIREYLREHEGEAFNEGLISRAVVYRKLIEDWMSERV